MQPKDATNFLDRLRPPLSRVVRAHHQLRLHAVDVRARVLHDAVVAVLQRTLAGDRDDRMDLDRRRHRDGLYRLDEVMTGRHVVHGRGDRDARTKRAGVAVDVRRHAGERERQREQSADDIGDELPARHEAAAVRGGDEDHAGHQR